MKITRFNLECIQLDYDWNGKARQSPSYKSKGHQARAGAIGTSGHKPKKKKQPNTKYRNQYNLSVKKTKGNSGPPTALCRSSSRLTTPQLSAPHTYSRTLPCFTKFYIKEMNSLTGEVKNTLYSSGRGQSLNEGPTAASYRAKGIVANTINKKNAQPQ